MTRPITLLLASAALFGGGIASAQTAPVAPAAEAQAGPEAELAATIKRFNDKNREVGQAYQKATTDEERAQVESPSVDLNLVTRCAVAAHRDGAFALAEAHPIQPQPFDPER